MNYEDLTPEQMEKAKACKSAEELIELAQSEGIELTDEELDSASGGWGCSVWCSDKKPCVRWFPH